jgi:hypothetical protein
MKVAIGLRKFTHLSVGNNIIQEETIFLSISDDGKKIKIIFQIKRLDHFGGFTIKALFRVYILLVK